MATSKTLKPTNVTIQIPAFTDQPDNRVNVNCIDKEADAINNISDRLANDHRILAKNDGTGFPTIGVTYLDNALSALFSNAATYESGGTYMINSSGGPYFFAFFAKYSENYYAALITTYNSEAAYPTIIAKRADQLCQVVYLSRI